MSFDAILFNDLLISKFIRFLPFDSVLSFDSTCRTARQKALQMYWSRYKRLQVVLQIRPNLKERLLKRRRGGNGAVPTLLIFAIVNGVELSNGVVVVNWLQSIEARLLAAGVTSLNSLVLETEFYVRHNGRLGKRVSDVLQGLVEYALHSQLSATELCLGGIFLSVHISSVAGVVDKLSSSLESIKLWGNSWSSPVTDLELLQRIGRLTTLTRLELSHVSLALNSIPDLLDHCKSPVRTLAVRETEVVAHRLFAGNVRWSSGVETLIYQQQNYSETQFPFGALPAALSAHLPHIRHLCYARSFACLSWVDENDSHVWFRTIGTDLPSLFVSCPTLETVELGQVDASSTTELLRNLLCYSPDVDLTRQICIAVYCISFRETWTELVDIKRLSSPYQIMQRFVNVFEAILDDKRIEITAHSPLARGQFVFYTQVDYLRQESLGCPVVLKFTKVRDRTNSVLFTLKHMSMPKEKENERVTIPCSF